MTRELLQKIAKESKINLGWYTHVHCFINENYTKLYIVFASLEVCGGYRQYCGQKFVTKSVAAIQRRNARYGETPEYMYTTQGWEEIETIR
jgi:hypothetical protein